MKDKFIEDKLDQTKDILAKEVMAEIVKVCGIDTKIRINFSKKFDKIFKQSLQEAKKEEGKKNALEALEFFIKLGEEALMAKEPVFLHEMNNQIEHLRKKLNNNN